MAALEPGNRDVRCAIYWAPSDDSALARVGAAWLGQDAASNSLRVRSTVAGFDDATFAALTAEPRCYGLHATLKPPLRLATATTVTALEAAMADFVAAPAALPAVRVSRIGNFVALVPVIPAPAVAALANACVEHLDRYRAPASEGEFA